jgi:hypothetical protein
MEFPHCIQAKRIHHRHTQQFVVEASVLSRKWQDKVENFQEVRKKSLELVPELGPSFEGAKEEIVQAGSGRNLEEEDKEKQQANPETTKELKT